MLSDVAPVAEKDDFILFLFLFKPPDENCERTKTVTAKIFMHIFLMVIDFS